MISTNNFLILISIILVFTSCSNKRARSLVCKAETLQSNGQQFDANNLLNRAIELDPKNIDAYLYRGINNSILGNHNDAIADLSKVISLDSDNTLAYFSRGQNKRVLEDYEGAIIDYNKAIKSKDEISIVWLGEENINNKSDYDVKIETIKFQLGIARYYFRDLHNALEDFNFSIKHEFEIAESSYFKGIILIELGQTEEGCNMMNIAKLLGESNAQNYIDKYCASTKR